MYFMPAGHVRSDFLVHNGDILYNPRDTSVVVAILLHGRQANTVRQSQIEAEAGTTPLPSKPGHTAYTVYETYTAISTLGLCLRSPGGLRQADYVRENYAQIAKWCWF